MINISKPLFVYLQRPDNGEWVTVGRYKTGTSGDGWFKYAPSYVDAGLTWAIDPVNLPFVPELDVPALRYRGLHDVLRDTCPDAWGQALLRKEYNLPKDAAPLQYLLKASNLERWGALAVGTSNKHPTANLNSPSLPLLGQLVEELIALSEGKPAIRPKIRSKIVQTGSLGGARPKTTVLGDNGQFWLVKPRIATDTADIPRLEHAAQQWGAASGLNFASTVLHTEVASRTVVRVLRFDRIQNQRHMCVSAASLLQAEYPDNFSQTDRYSYPRLAEELRRVGAPLEDRVELFGRMIFNAVCGNDDDHVRNHAIVYSANESCWRLSPAFDVVPNPVETPTRLNMQLSLGRFDISREAALADIHRFGFATRGEAEKYLDELLDRISASFHAATSELDKEWKDILAIRLQHNVAALKGLT